MDEASIIQNDPFLAALRTLPGMHLLPPAIAEALLHLPAQAFDARRANQEHVPPLMTIESQRGYLAGDLVRYIEHALMRRGPIKIRHPSFTDFLTQGQPNDEWIFGTVALDFHGMRRPVDLVTCLELPTTLLADAHYQHMTWKDYVEAMDHYLFLFQGQQQAEALATERARHALSVTPDKKAGRRPPSKDRS